MRRWIVPTLIGIPALLALVATGIAAWVWTALPKTSGTIPVAGVSEDIEIVRDRYGVPHIFAGSDKDAYFALGFVHAQDRFWQMETMRRLGAGRLSEVFGDVTLSSDEWMRTLGLYRLAETQVNDLPAEVRDAFGAYASGVNQWLATEFGLTTVETALFSYRPEPWKIADSLVWAKLMAHRLALNFRTEVLRAELAARLPAERVRELWPAYPDQAPVTAAGLSRRVSADRVAGLSALRPRPEGAPRGASNVWVVNGARTESGKPLLANDPHLGFSAPILWYLARVESPSLRLAGATVPGTPFHILGQTDHLAWGLTSTQADLEDLFIEELDPEDGKRYRVPGGTEAFATRTESIKVDGAQDVALTVRETRHGPVIFDLVQGLEGLTGESHVAALAATYFQPGDRSPAAFYYLNRADGWRRFREALKFYQGPMQNFVVATKDGDIAFMAPGLAPRRGHGMGMVPSAGWLGETDWRGFIDFEALPTWRDPASGVLFNANNRIVGEDYPHFLSLDWAPPYRARRIETVLSERSVWIPDDMTALQMDAKSAMAEVLLPLMLEEIGETTEASAAVLQLLSDWDGTMGRDRPEPLIFLTWLRELNLAIYGDELGNLTQRFLRLRPLFIKSVLTRLPHWCDDSTTPQTEEDCPSRLDLALERALASLGKRFGEDPATWAWRDVHVARFSHPVLAHVPLINRFSELEIATDGGPYTVNRGDSFINRDRDPFGHRHGAGYRGVYDLAEPRNSRFMIATGQSGNPFSPHYSDLMVPWRDGESLNLLAFSRRELVEQAGADRLVLRPAGGL